MPQNIDPNHRTDPIAAANLAIARLHNERNQMLHLIADMRAFLAGDYPMDTAIRHKYRTVLIERADAALKGE